MSAMRSNRDPAPLSECITELLAMGQVDGCPECPNIEPARSWVPLDHGYRTSHLCADCERAWTTDWKAL